MPSHFRPSKTNEMHYFGNFCYYIMFLAILPNNDDLNGAKLSQNIFHFERTAIFFKIGQFTKLFYIFVVSLSYDAS